MFDIVVAVVFVVVIEEGYSGTTITGLRLSSKAPYSDIKNQDIKCPVIASCVQISSVQIMNHVYYMLQYPDVKMYGH